MLEISTDFEIYPSPIAVPLESLGWRGSGSQIYDIKEFKSKILKRKGLTEDILTEAIIASLEANVKLNYLVSRFDARKLGGRVVTLRKSAAR